MRRALLGQNSTAGSMRVPPGTIIIWPSSTIPNGWLLCDGTNYASGYLRYPALYAAIADTYGADLAGDFKVPDLRGRVPYGVSTSPSRPLGTTGGVTTVQLTAAESALRQHTHTYEDQQNNNSYASCNAASGAASTYNQTSNNENTTAASSGASSAHTNLQPYILLNFIIKT